MSMTCGRTEFYFICYDLLLHEKIVEKDATNTKFIRLGMNEEFNI